MENGHTDSGGLLANCGEGGGFSFVFGFVVCYIYSVEHIFYAGNQIYYGKFIEKSWLCACGIQILRKRAWNPYRLKS